MAPPPPPPPLLPHLFRGINTTRPWAKATSVDDWYYSSERLSELRKLMRNERIDYYIIPSDDAHQSEYVAASDKRREYISGFTGSAGTAIVSLNNACLFTDSRYYIQAEKEIDRNWTLFKVGTPNVKPWNEWILDGTRGAIVGIDSRLIAHDTAIALTSALKLKGMRMVYPQRNLVDLIWKDRPSKSAAPIYKHDPQFAGEHTSDKLEKLRAWLQEYPGPQSTSTFRSSYSTFISSLSGIAWLLNLRGGDIPSSPWFHAYLWIGEDSATLFVDSRKLSDEVNRYLIGLRVGVKEFGEVWGYLRRREFGSGKVIIQPNSPHVVPLMLASETFIVAPPYVDPAKAIKNQVEIEGFRRAYLRDGVAMTKWFAWLEGKLQDGFEFTEWEASERLTQFRKQGEHFMGLAFENISAANANAALPHYLSTKSRSLVFAIQTLYLNRSGGQYKDGMCDTTRTVHFSRPSNEQREAFTRVLKAHIAIDVAVFPIGTTGKQLDFHARCAMWKDGSDFSHNDASYRFGSFLSLQDERHEFGTDIPLEPGHIIITEPAFYKENSFGVRIGSTLVVKKVETNSRPGDGDQLGFERLTCVPIQTQMVKMDLLTKEERRWLKEHNKKCRDMLAPHLIEDNRALKWSKRQLV